MKGTQSLNSKPDITNTYHPREKLMLQANPLRLPPQTPFPVKMIGTTGRVTKLINILINNKEFERAKLVYNQLDLAMEMFREMKIKRSKLDKYTYGFLVNALGGKEAA
uniref:Uncharacterized protein n=1 Tax=Physcomitrium patens TaxID=3218 RepID=A0A2K1K3A8_PHYPA|nr:hypothetical protein PHYPA_012738 [Physcomitrium patens]